MTHQPYLYIHNLTVTMITKPLATTENGRLSLAKAHAHFRQLFFC